MDIEKRTARPVMAGLVTAGAVMAAVGAVSPDGRVATTLPAIGAGLLAAGIIILVQAESIAGRRAMLLGGALVFAGAALAVIGSTIGAASAASLAPLGGGMVAAGVVALVSSASSRASGSRLSEI